MHGEPGYLLAPRILPRRVWFEGTGALRLGQGVCYTATYGTAASESGARRNYVNVPSTTNNLHFAGTTLQAYAANAKGQMIDIAEPGGLGYVDLTVDVVIDTGRVTCLNSGDATVSGCWHSEGLPGRGSAIPLQTNASGNLHTSLDGSATINTTTLTKTGVGTAYTAAIAADANAVLKVYIFGGALSAGASAVAPGLYTVSAASGADAVILTASAAASIGYCAYAMVSSVNYPVALAYLEDGPESGLARYVVPLAGAAAAPAHLASGANFVCGGYTCGTASTGTLADGTKIGQLVRFLGRGTLTTAGLTLTVTTGVKSDGTTGITTLIVDAAAETFTLGWYGVQWRLLDFKGATVS